MKKLLLIDGTAHLYRSFYALPPLTDPQGRMVNVVYGFAQTLLNVLAKIEPTHLVIVFDTPSPTHRHAAYPEYKAQREAAPEELKRQTPWVKELVRAFPVAVLEREGLEADDLIGLLARKAEQDGFETLIFSSDKDLFQLVNDKVKILRPQKGGKGDFELLDASGVESVFGVPPGQVRDVLALMGDASDNIPGVPGIGPKTAVKLVKEFGSLDKLYAGLDRVFKERERRVLAEHQDQARLSGRLLDLALDEPLEVIWDQCRTPGEISHAAYRLMAEYGFKSLLGQRPEAAPATDWAAGLQGDVSLETVVQEARQTRTLSIEWLPAGLALASSARQAAYLPLGRDELLRRLSAGEEWVTLLEDPAVTKIGYNLKPLLVLMRRAGRRWAGPLADLHLAAHLLDLPSTRDHDFISRILGGPPPSDQPGLAASAHWLIAQSLPARLKASDAEKIYQDVELPLVPVLADMEAEGVGLDVEALHDMSARLGLQLEALEKQIHREAGVVFNIRSPQQLGEVLFDRLQLSPGKKTKTGRSTSVDVLETLAAIHPLPAKVLEYRQLQKLKSTYLDVLPALIDPVDGRLHTTFHQVGAATGRLSSSDPNLQNIPIRTELGRELRRMFVPATASDCLMSADYSQVELRLLAHLSGDARMLEDFVQGLDIHQAMAAEIFNVPLDQVTSDMRRQAKTCNFGIAYGVSPFGLSRQLAISPMRARDYIDDFYRRYPGVRLYLDSLLEGARSLGYVSTLLGRRRSTPDVQSANRTIREAGERMAINTPIQGSAADLIKLAMIRISQELGSGGWKSRMILQVHDELLFEGPESEMPALKAKVVQLMSQVYPLQVELTVEASWGPNWMQAHV